MLSAGPGATDAALAVNLRSNVERSMLPKVLRAHGATPEEASSEMVDGYTYKLSEADRKSVEQQRVDLLPHWCASRRSNAPPINQRPSSRQIERRDVPAMEPTRRSASVTTRSAARHRANSADAHLSFRLSASTQVLRRHHRAT